MGASAYFAAPKCDVALRRNREVPFAWGGGGPRSGPCAVGCCNLWPAAVFGTVFMGRRSPDGRTQARLRLILSEMPMRANLNNPNAPFCSILELRRGTRAVVRGYEGGDVESTRALARRLTAMGMPIGCEAEVLVQRKHGPILLRACGSRIALGQDEARCIRVEQCSAPEHCVAPERCGHPSVCGAVDSSTATPVEGHGEGQGESSGR